MVAEIYGPTEDGRLQVAGQVKQRMERLDGVVDVDWYVEPPQPKHQLLIDSEKAALHGVSPAEIARTLRLASAGDSPGLLHDDNAKEDVPLDLRLIAGALIMLSLVLAHYSDPRRLYFTAFIGINLFQSAFTNWCPMITVLKKIGVRSSI